MDSDIKESRFSITVDFCNYANPKKQQKNLKQHQVSLKNIIQKMDFLKKELMF